jgi:RND family efflux transporter MFP subunit
MNEHKTTLAAGVGATVLLLAVAAGVSGCRSAEAAAQAAEPAKGASAQENAAAVRLGDVEHGPIARPIRGTGVVRLKSEADLSFKVGGVIAALYAEEGAQVRKGQVLARLDPTEVDAALRQAKEGATKADRDLDRVSRLTATGALPTSNMEDAQTASALSHAALSAAQFNAQRSQIVAPDDGRIDRRMAENGEVAAPGRPIFHLSGRSRGAVVKIGLTDRDVLRVTEGDSAHVTTDASPDVVLDGVVSQIATVASPQTGTFDVEIRLTAPPLGMLSGLTAKVVLPHDEKVAAVVPVSALALGKGTLASVFTVVDGHAKKVDVKVAFLDGDRAALSSAALAPGSRVAGGASQLTDGELVRVVP